MGRFTIQSETLFDYPQEVVWNFATNPNNWGKTYAGSGGMHHDTKFPLSFGDTWTERVELEKNTYLSTWTLIRTDKPMQFVFQQQNDIAIKEDGSGAIHGTTTIAYRFEDMGQGRTLFTRTIHAELPRGVGIPDDLLTVCCRPDGIERYHDAIKKHLDEEKARS